ncbi:unnamed protein product [Spirodela intermedia]|uniref:AAA+ ATPase domain-containing protein n=1 Tax=Spirodela intermedia TaxID=51605 RepID=A0A7I8LIZ4_SPIIN|nr:unnamed protein product [Spirodela intermedia]
MNPFLVCLGFFWDPLSQGVQNFLQSSTGEAVSWVWNLAAGGIVTLILLDSRAEELGREMTDLICLREDLEEHIKQGELEDMGPTSQAKNWLRKVQEIESREADFRVSFQQRGASPEGSSLRSSYRLGCEAAECLKEVQRLKTQRGNLLPLLIQAPPPAVVPQPISSASIVDAEKTLSEIRSLLEDNEAPVIGIYGLGGVGKTTLLKAINNEFLQRGSGGFDLVIWVTVSKELDVRKVQEDIAVRLGYSRPGKGQGQTLPEHPTDRVNTLLSALSKRNFLLLLDDLWEKLDLEAVGVPFSSSFRNGSKVVFTTRSEKVCNDMDAQRKVKVPLLNRKSSWKLFCQKLGREEDQWDPSMRSLAEAVAAKCGGLPITLITVGRAMAGVTTPDEWQEALMALKGIPVELGDMKEVLILLKFSFDRLKDTSAKECLLYCALFPEDHNIVLSVLIDYWVGEGLLDRGSYPDPIDRARNRGLVVITTLKAACLLEDGAIKGTFVKLHDTVREMALWITSGEGDKRGNVFLVNSGEQLRHVPTPERWTEARRISLMRNEIRLLPEEPRCPNLQTLLLNHNRPHLEEIPGGFFQFMPSLRVLDLSWTKIKVLPREIGSLVELRYLNLSRTPLESLPMEVRNLTKLRQLDLENTRSLKSIPRETVSSLERLQSLNIYRSKFRAGGEGGGSDGVIDHEGRQLCLKDLEDGMWNLTELGISITWMTHEDMQAVLNSQRLSASIRFLGLLKVGIRSLDLSAFHEILKGLRILEISDSTDLEELVFNTNHFSELEELALDTLPRATISWKDGNVFASNIFKNLRGLWIIRCEALEDITWIRQLPCIQELILDGCSRIEEVIVVEEVTVDNVDYENDSFFPKLQLIWLYDLPNLRSICRHPLLFPALERINVSNCPELKKLPFGLSTAKNIKEIVGEKEWLEQLEWEHEDVRSKFTPCFQPM